LKRIFGSLFFATATAMLGLGIISPILPLYARTFAASGIEIGLVFTMFSISRALLGPFVGRFSDRVGRKPLILLGLTGYALVSVLYASAGTLWQLGLFRFIQGIASVMVTPLAQAYIGDLTPKGREGRYMNAFFAAQFIGMAFGPLLGGVIGVGWSHEASFYVMGGLSVLSLALVLVTVPTDRQRVKECRARPEDIIPLRRLISNDAVKAICIYFATRGIWRQSFTAFFPLYAVAALHVNEKSIGIVLSIYMFAEGLLQIPFGFLADHYPKTRQVVIGSVFAPLSLLAVPYLSSIWAIAAVTFAMGAFSALGRASLVAIRTELGRTHGMATLAGLHASSFALGQTLGPLVSGAMVDGFGLVSVFPLGTAVGCAGTVLVLFWMRRWVRKLPTAPDPAGTD
jgi:DHA1 family multidrug resistance protein-like MFS transporter